MTPLCASYAMLCRSSVHEVSMGVWLPPGYTGVASGTAAEMSVFVVSVPVLFASVSAIVASVFTPEYESVGAGDAAGSEPALNVNPGALPSLRLSGAAAPFASAYGPAIRRFAPSSAAAAIVNVSGFPCMTPIGYVESVSAAGIPPMASAADSAVPSPVGIVAAPAESGVCVVSADA